MSPDLRMSSKEIVSAVKLDDGKRGENRDGDFQYMVDRG